MPQTLNSDPVKPMSKLIVMLAVLGYCVLAARAGTASTRPATVPDDPATDWLLGNATPVSPTTRPANDRPAPPASRPASPLLGAQHDGARDGVIVLSNGEKIPGRIATTAEKPLRVWDAKQQTYRDVPFASIQRIDAGVVWERDEREWHFKASGSDIKEYTGKTYPARELQYTLTLLDGTTVTGGVVAPLCVLAPDQTATYVLYKRQKGEPGTTLDRLVYVRRVELKAPTTAPAEKAKGD